MTPPASSAAPAAGPSYSQWGEDRLVLEYFAGRRDGVFFEAGASHPVRLSQTYLLEQHGWGGVLVEPQTAHAEEFTRLRPRSRLVRAALGAPEQAGRAMRLAVPRARAAEARLLGEGETAAADEDVIEAPLTTLDAVLAEAGVAKLDFLSLDLEGHELAALRGFDFARWRPALIIIEDHLAELSRHRFLQARGYRLVYRTGSNNWYVPAGAPFPRADAAVRLRLFRKLYLNMPFRKLRVALRRARGRPA